MRLIPRIQATFAIIVIILVIGALFYLPAWNNKTGSIVISDRQGKELFSLQETDKKHIPVHFQDIPETIIASTLAAEDKNFFDHEGIDWLATLRAFTENISSGEIVSGGSTITQQLIRNVLGTNRERSIINKSNEMFLSVLTEKVLTKDQILESYLNTIFYGYNNNGIAAAAQWYFDSDFRQLDWNQATFLAVMPQNTTQFNPYTNFAAVRKRQSWLVDQLLKEKKLSEEEASFIRNNPPKLSSPLKKITAPHFVHFVLGKLEEKWGNNFWHGHDVKVTTTLDSQTYEDNKQIINEQIKKLDQHNVHNAGGLVLDNASGEIISYVGNNDYFDIPNEGAVDMVQALRQPGSAIKPFIYLGAILKGWGTGTMIYDIPSRFQTAQNTPYTPLNYDLDYHGPVTIREALANSYNIPAVKTLDFLGITEAKRLLTESGITSLKESDDYYGLSLALGSGEVSLYELTNAYRILAEQGIYTEPKFIRSIRIDDGTETFSNEKNHPVWEKNAAKREEATTLITDILSDNYARLPEFGENNALEFSFPVAAKTGTSRNFNDNWTLGFSSQFTVGVWVGNSNGAAMSQVSGITGAGPIFHNIMSLLHKSAQAHNFETISKIPQVTICLPSGLLPNTYCTHKSAERFPEGQEPKTLDTWYTERGLTLPAELNFWQSKFATTTLSQPTLKIISPQNNDVFTFDPEIPDDKESIPCKLFQSQVHDVLIKLNNQTLKNCQLPKQSGNYKLEVTGIDSQGQTLQDQVLFSIN